MACDPRMEVFRGRGGKFYFHKRCGNGRRTNPSQGYVTQGSARKAAHKDEPDLPVVFLPEKK